LNTNRDDSSRRAGAYRPALERREWAPVDSTPAAAIPNPDPCSFWVGLKRVAGGSSLHASEAGGRRGEALLSSLGPRCSPALLSKLAIGVCFDGKAAEPNSEKILSVLDSR
jgi:hypothetical protein